MILILFTFIFVNGCGRGSLKETQHYSNSGSSTSSDNNSSNSDNNNSQLTTYVWNDSNDNTTHWFADSVAGLSASITSVFLDIRADYLQLIRYNDTQNQMHFYKNIKGVQDVLDIRAHVDGHFFVLTQDNYLVFYPSENRDSDPVIIKKSNGTKVQARDSAGKIVGGFLGDLFYFYDTNDSKVYTFDTANPTNAIVEVTAAGLTGNANLNFIGYSSGFNLIETNGGLVFSVENTLNNQQILLYLTDQGHQILATVTQIQDYFYSNNNIYLFSNSSTTNKYLLQKIQLSDGSISTIKDQLIYVPRFSNSNHSIQYFHSEFIDQTDYLFFMGINSSGSRAAVRIKKSDGTTTNWSTLGSQSTSISTHLMMWLNTDQLFTYEYGSGKLFKLANAITTGNTWSDVSSSIDTTSEFYNIGSGWTQKPCVQLINNQLLYSSQGILKSLNSSSQTTQILDTTSAPLSISWGSGVTGCEILQSGNQVYVKYGNNIQTHVIYNLTFDQQGQIQTTVTPFTNNTSIGSADFNHASFSMNGNAISLVKRSPGLKLAEFKQGIGTYVTNVMNSVFTGSNETKTSMIYLNSTNGDKYFTQVDEQNHYQVDVVKVDANGTSTKLSSAQLNGARLRANNVRFTLKSGNHVFFACGNDFHYYDLDLSTDSVTEYSFSTDFSYPQIYQMNADQIIVPFSDASKDGKGWKLITVSTQAVTNIGGTYFANRNDNSYKYQLPAYKITDDIFVFVARPTFSSTQFYFYKYSISAGGNASQLSIITSMSSSSSNSRYVDYYKLKDLAFQTFQVGQKVYFKLSTSNLLDQAAADELWSYDLTNNTVAAKGAAFAGTKAMAMMGGNLYVSTSDGNLSQFSFNGTETIDTRTAPALLDILSSMNGRLFAISAASGTLYEVDSQFNFTSMASIIENNSNGAFQQDNTTLLYDSLYYVYDSTNSSGLYLANDGQNIYFQKYIFDANANKSVELYRLKLSDNTVTKLNIGTGVEKVLLQFDPAFSQLPFIFKTSDNSQLIIQTFKPGAISGTIKTTYLIDQGNLTQITTDTQM